ncbi:hypothetical protein KGM_212798 [Danaus plexippus plexippus]|uniref:Uncharacterized protein n=1 Tax=Danaus plexippus plexippus TaxID=278856 RepID=A0A212FPR1_DANPL|nr:hypothetical protein KGM_212798 [Danaus plexippus plexippus]
MYPKFLDDMLDSVGGLVNDLYESSVDGDLMLEVDEKIQRIFLLNRSHHIMRYTIELITGKLEKLHTKLCDSIEITQTATTENLLTGECVEKKLTHRHMEEEVELE